MRKVLPCLLLLAACGHPGSPPPRNPGEPVSEESTEIPPDPTSQPEGPASADSKSEQVDVCENCEPGMCFIGYSYPETRYCARYKSQNSGPAEKK